MFPGENKLTQGLPGNLATKRAYQEEPINSDNRTMSLEPADIDEMTQAESPTTQDLLNLLQKNLSPKDTLPLPENTLYHGLKVFHDTARKALSGIAGEGMKGGWFSEEPHQPFGPNFIATTPEDLPPLLVRSKQFNVDPEKEIIPRWKKMDTKNLETLMQLRGKSPRAELSPETVKGRPAVRSNWPNIHQLVGADESGGGVPLASGGHVVPPEKLFLTDRTGNVIGRMAPKQGKNAINELWDRVKSFRNVLERGTKSEGKAAPGNQFFQEPGTTIDELPEGPLKDKLMKAAKAGGKFSWDDFLEAMKGVAVEDIPK